MKNEESAFPHPGQDASEHSKVDDLVFPSQGMTLRDWYVGQALIGLLSNSHIPTKFSDRVEAAFDVADRVMETRTIRP